VDHILTIRTPQSRRIWLSEQSAICVQQKFQNVRNERDREQKMPKMTVGLSDKHNGQAHRNSGTNSR